MNILALPELPQLAGVLPDQNQSGQITPSSNTIEQIGADIAKIARGGRPVKGDVRPATWWTDLPRIGTFLLGFLLIAGAIFAPRDIKSAATTAAKAAAL